MWPSRTFPLLTALPARWQQAVRLLSQEKILGPDRKYAAFLGDKFLGAATAAAIQKLSEPYNEESASRLTGTILSNKFLAERVESILPFDVYTNAAKLVSVHSVGTMVEAAVAAIKDDNEGAVEDLVNWLIDEASNLDMNGKGRLLELGGTVSAIRTGGSNHSPVFKANACLGNHLVEAEANSKKDAEQKASSECLKDLGYVTHIREDRETRVMDPAPVNQWNLFEVDSENTRVHLKGETLLEWWLRAAADPKRAFRRAMLTPLVFPKRIIAVDSWTRRSANEAAVLAVISYSIDNGRQSSASFVEVAKSAKKARASVGIELNKRVSELLEMQLPLREGKESK